MKGPHRLSAWAAVFLAGCGGGDALDPEPQPSPPAAPPPAPIAASVVIETRKIIQDYLSGAELDFNEWAGTDTLIIRPGLESPVIRVTARQ